MDLVLLCPCLSCNGDSRTVPSTQWLHQCWVKEKDQLSQPSGNTLPNTNQATVWATRAHCWLMIKLLISCFAESLQSCFQASWPPACADGWDYSFLDTGLLLFLLHDLFVGSFVQAVAVALKWQHNHLVYQHFLPFMCTQAHVPGD